MKKSLVTALLLCSAWTHAQLDIVSYNSGTNFLHNFSIKDAMTLRKGKMDAGVIDFDASASELGVTGIWKFVDRRDGADRGRLFRPSNLVSLKGTLGLQENMFTLFDETLKPGGSMAFSYTRKMAHDGKKYTMVNAGLKNSMKNLRNALITQDTLLTVSDNFNNETEVQISLNWVKKDNGVKRILGVGVSGGFELNSGDHLSEMWFCKTTASRLAKQDDAAYYSRMDCKKYFDGAMRDVKFTSVLMYFSHRLNSLETKDKNTVHFAAIPKMTLMEFNIPRYDIAAGFSLNEFPNKVASSLLFRFDDLLDLSDPDKDLRDVFSIQL